MNLDLQYLLLFDAPLILFAKLPDIKGIPDGTPPVFKKNTFHTAYQ